MKLSGMFRISFVAAIVTALILLPSRIAAGGSNEASTSTPLQRYYTGQPGAVFNINDYIKSLNYRNINDYIKSLDYRNIHKLPEKPANTYRKVPFYEGTPAYSIETPIETVRQALRDHGSVSIVDAPNEYAKRIVLNDGNIKIEMMRNEKSALINIFKHLDPNLHLLRNMVRSNSINEDPGVNIDHLPVVNGKPMLFQDSATLGHMITAARTEPKKFYYVPHGRVPILIDPNIDKLIVDEGRNVEEDPYRVMVGYNSAKNQYGESLASIIWGKPIKPSTDNLRTAKISLKDSPRFRHDGPRDAMARSLKNSKLIRVYKEINGKEYDYKVKVLNPLAKKGEALRFSVKPVSTLERLQMFFRFTH
ncbi:uncharacterized protein UHO2_06367 [Ustilago hordei]|uniref:uncharacterized protein n=1 Tax=Ustilago hordei TaxID=120017 RepID=UPI001A374983|nr:uncharacterized protein UHO2_06367 [Ustilago hordei]SYW80905.1 uncharacterized protein UHO2_06367 [Ustilago hordei]